MRNKECAAQGHAESALAGRIRVCGPGPNVCWDTPALLALISGTVMVLSMGTSMPVCDASACSAGAADPVSAGSGQGGWGGTPSESTVLELKVPADEFLKMFPVPQDVQSWRQPRA